MIRIVSSVPSSQAISLTDQWIPLSVRWNLALDGSPLYLFVRDPKQGYVELKVHPDSGALVGFVVIDAPRDTGRIIDSVPPGQESASPTLDLELWPWRATPDYREPSKRDIDAEVALSQTVTGGALAVWFSSQQVHHFVQAGGAHVGISSDGGLVAIVATGLAILPNGGAT